jgi:hypothetical protein
VKNYLEKNMKNKVEKITAKRYPGDKIQKYKTEFNGLIMCDMQFYFQAPCNDVLKTDFYC